jgi:hypothetical protein
VIGVRHETKSKSKGTFEKITCTVKISRKVKPTLFFYITSLDMNSVYPAFSSFLFLQKKVLWLHVQTILHRISDVFFLLALPSVVQRYGNCWGLRLDCVARASSLQIPSHLFFSRPFGSTWTSAAMLQGDTFRSFPRRLDLISGFSFVRNT